MKALTALESLYEMERGVDLSLPPELALLYGHLAFPRHLDRVYVIGNFVTTLDGVVALSDSGHGGGGDIMGEFFAEQALDELFLTLAPQIAGRAGEVERPGLVMGKLFAPENPLWGTLVSVKRGGSHLFLRYAFTGRNIE